MNHTSLEDEDLEDRCDCERKTSIPFLDTLITIKDGRIDVDLYRKDTDRNQYLLPSSCHTKQTTTAIPYSLALRIVRTCTDPQNRENCFAEMKTRLLQRGYNLRIVESAIDRARKVPRSAALKCTKPTQSQGPVFAVTYDPRLPAIGSIHARQPEIHI